MAKYNVFKPTTAEARVIRIAAHLRRGDVETNRIKGKKRITEDDAYIELFSALKAAISRVLPGAEVDAHAFTSCSHSLSNSACDKYSDSITRVYRSYGITVHVDYENSAAATEEAIRTWAHFISADVFVVAKSSFSYTPAMFNAGCVIYEPHWSKPLPDWLTVNMTWAASKANAAELRRHLEQHLSRCLEQRMKRRLALD
jgi:hypothetical protein